MPAFDRSSGSFRPSLRSNSAFEAQLQALIAQAQASGANQRASAPLPAQEAFFTDGLGQGAVVGTQIANAMKKDGDPNGIPEEDLEPQFGPDNPTPATSDPAASALNGANASGRSGLFPTPFNGPAGLAAEEGFGDLFQDGFSGILKKIFGR